MAEDGEGGGSGVCTITKGPELQLRQVSPHPLHGIDVVADDVLLLVALRVVSWAQYSVAAEACPCGTASQGISKTEG